MDDCEFIFSVADGDEVFTLSAVPENVVIDSANVPEDMSPSHVSEGQPPAPESPSPVENRHSHTSGDPPAPVAEMEDDGDEKRDADEIPGHVGENGTLEVAPSSVVNSVDPEEEGIHENGDSKPSYISPGSVVWVKIQKHRWPCVVQDPATCPEELVENVRRKPVAIVKFLGEEKYEVVHAADRIYPYDHPEKMNFIRKTLRSLQKDLQEKFRRDVEESEKIMGTEGDIWEKLSEEDRESADSKKTLKAAFCGPVDVVEEQIHYMTVIGDFRESFVDRPTEMQRLRDQVRGDAEFRCPWCQFVTTRVNNIVSHFKIHSATGPRFEPQLASAAWFAMREKQLAKENRKRMKQLAANAAKVPIVLGPDGKPRKKHAANNEDGSPVKKKKKKEEKPDLVPRASELVAEWDVTEEDERKEEEEEKRLRANRETLLEQQKRIDNVFDELLKDTSVPPKATTFNRFCLPASGDDDDAVEDEDEAASENGVAGESISDDDEEHRTEPNPYDFHESDEESASVSKKVEPPRKPEGVVEVAVVEQTPDSSHDAVMEDVSSSEQHEEVVERFEDVHSAESTESEKEDVEETKSEEPSVGSVSAEGATSMGTDSLPEQSEEENSTTEATGAAKEGESAAVVDHVDVDEEAPLATVEIAEGASISANTRQAVIVAQKDPDTDVTKLLLVTMDESGKVESISPLDDLNPEEQAALAREIGLSTDPQTSLPEQLSSRFADLTSVVTVGNVSAEGAEAAAALVLEPAAAAGSEEELVSEDPPPSVD